MYLQITHGTAVNNSVRQLADSIGTAIVVTIFTVQSLKHTEKISKELPTASIDYLKALASIYRSSDAYIFLTILSLLSLIITIFYPNRPKSVPTK